MNWDRSFSPVSISVAFSLVFACLFIPTAEFFKGIDRVLIATHTFYGQEQTISVYQDPDEIRYGRSRIFKESGVVLVEDFFGQSPRVPVLAWRPREPSFDERHLWDSYFGTLKAYPERTSSPFPLSWTQILTSPKKF